MKRATRWAGLWILTWIAATGFAPPAAAQATGAGTLENVTFERLPGRERVTLSLSRPSAVTVENLPGDAVLVRIENLRVPEGLSRPLADAAMRQVLRVTPVQQGGDGPPRVAATIDLKQRLPYSVRQEGASILVEFNVTSAVAAGGPPPGAERAAPGPAATEAGGTAATAGRQKGQGAGGARILLDVQEADIKAVLRLLAEQGGVNIVSGEDVKGTVTLKVRDVSWAQALDTVLSVTGLGKRQQGNVITVMSLERIKKDEADRAALEKEKEKQQEAEQLREPLITRVVPIAYNDPDELKRNIEELLKSREAKDGREARDGKDGRESRDSRTTADGKAAAGGGSVTIDKHTRSLIIKATRREMDGLLRFIERIDKPTEQILIKANIVETTKSTARNLGIQWGGIWGQRVGSQGLYITPGGSAGSAVAPGAAFSGAYSPASGQAGISGQGFGVNFPAASILGVDPASVGLMFGSIGGNILELQLTALQKDGKLNILSSPLLVTLDNQTASTENGEDVPFVTPGTSTSPATVTWKRAVLRLEIKPHVIDGSNIKLSINVRKDEPNYAQSVGGNPPIIVKETKTDLVVTDGETVVISGFTKQRKDSSTDGVPWLKELPVLGWLFKGEGKSESMEEVLIFITPSIVKPQTAVGIQEGA